IDFDDNAAFTRANIGGPAHLLNYPPNGEMMYVSPQADLTTIDSSGSTNFGVAIKIANDEFVAHGDPTHAKNLILLTDGQNTACVPSPPCSSNSGGATDSLPSPDPPDGSRRNQRTARHEHHPVAADASILPRDRGRTRPLGHLPHPRRGTADRDRNRV